MKDYASAATFDDMGIVIRTDWRMKLRTHSYLAKR